jgi:predicted ATP-grasp superfamily ATP-dependent carboligase
LFSGQRDNSALFLGATRQLIGVTWLRARPFRYCGNIGPLPLPARVMNTLGRIGSALTRAFALRGIFGIDFVLRQEVPWMVEVNPRLTAGLEVLERAAGRSFFAYHHAVFSPSAAASEASSMDPSAVCGKAILFAKAPLTFPADGPWLASLGQPWTTTASAEYADIPAPHTRIDQRQPIVTLFARAKGTAECIQMLRVKAQGVARSLFG